MRAASSRESTSVITKADSIPPRSKRREGALSAGGSNRNDGEHHIMESVLEPVAWTLSTTGGSWVSVGGPASRRLTLGRCVLLLGRSGAELRAVHARRAVSMLMKVPTAVGTRAILSAKADSIRYSRQVKPGRRQVLDNLDHLRHQGLLAACACVDLALGGCPGPSGWSRPASPA